MATPATQTKLTKRDIVTRHFDSAIEMLFRKMDPLSIALISHAGLKIAIDILQKDDAESLKEIISDIAQGKDFFSLMCGIPNHLKHADRDAHEVIEDFDYKLPMHLIGISLAISKQLNLEPTIKMHIFEALVGSIYLRQDEESESLDANLRKFVASEPELFLSIGRELLDLAKENNCNTVEAFIQVAKFAMQPPQK